MLLPIKSNAHHSDGSQYHANPNPIFVDVVACMIYAYSDRHPYGDRFFDYDLQRKQQIFGNRVSNPLTA